ncbi:MAG: biotin--[acetyl-CoA-carboxylase] ligase [Capsulimonadales bacterium]|nr:biotin--[acetyl-CoA-carboxylase] ligase [Capsulimonadales bacterium]
MAGSPSDSSLPSSAEPLPLFGTRIYRYDVITSTQDRAREWIEKGAEPGTVVTARAMTAGRGRLGRVWHAPASANLNLTAIGPPVPPDSLWQIPLVMGRAVADAIRDVLPEQRVGLRFPNDIVFLGRKVAGILVETAVSPRSGDRLPMIGIGINVRSASLPPEIAERAIALEEIGGAVTVEAVERATLERMTRCWSEWQQEGVEEMLINYHAYLDPTARRNFVVDGRNLPCRLVRVFANGAVVIETEEGVQRAFHAAQVVPGDD